MAEYVVSDYVQSDYIRDDWDVWGSYTFDGPSKLIILNSGVTEVDVDDLYSRWVDWVAVQEHSRFLPAIRYVGGDAISATKNLGITFFLMNDWRIRPQEASHTLRVNGNLYTDPSGFSPFVPTVGSHNDMIEMTVSSLVDSSVARLDTDNIRYQIESLRPSHQGFGQPFYVSPSGDNSNPGNNPALPVQTIARALELVSSGRGDVIYLLAPDAGAATYAENVVITKEDVHLRGPGRGVNITPTSGVGIRVEAQNCSLSGFVSRTYANSTSDNIVINAKFCRLQDLYIVGADSGGVTPIGNGVGIHFKGGDYHKVINCEIEKAGSDGVRFTDAPIGSEGSPREVQFRDCNIYYNRGSGIKFTGTSLNSTRLNMLIGCRVQHNSEKGVWIGENTQRTMIMADNYIKDNGTYPDGASNPDNEIYIDPLATDPMVDVMPGTSASAVWSVQASDNNSDGTMGNKLNTASSGGVDLSALANAVWSNAKALTVGKFLGLK